LGQACTFPRYLVDISALFVHSNHFLLLVELDYED